MKRESFKVSKRKDSELFKWGSSLGKITDFLERYSRQMVMSKIGKDGQKKLVESTVAILGLGGIGSVASFYLAGAGVNLKLIDRDLVSLSDLHRQILYTEEDLGKPKAYAAKEKLSKLNSKIEIEALSDEFNPANAEEFITGSDLVLDATDNFETRFLLNDVCVKHNKPFTYAAAIQDRGLFMFIQPQETPCLRCLMEEPPKPGTIGTCATVGVIGPAPGFVGVLSASEAIKYLTGYGENLKNKLLVFELGNFSLDLVKVSRNMNCKTCVKRKFEYLEGKTWTKASPLCGVDTYQVRLEGKGSIDLAHLSLNLSKNPYVKVKTRSNQYLLLNYNQYNVTVLTNGRVLVRGAKSVSEARKIANLILSM